MKVTTLNQKHKDLGAKMVDFAGYEMPLHYGDMVSEHMAVRKNAGIFDVSHMGEFKVSGPQAKDFIHHMVSNDVTAIPVEGAQYNCLLNKEGGIVDDLIVYRLASDEFMLVVNAANIDKDFEWLSANNTFDCQLENISDSIALLAIQGPNAAEGLQKLTDTDLGEIPFYHFKKGSLGGVDDVILSNTGYTGAGGFEVYVPTAQAGKVWDALFEANPDLVPCGLGSRDSLRLEVGYCLYGNEINDDTSPYDAGLAWITKPKSKSTSIAGDTLLERKKAAKNRLVGMVVDGKRFARQGNAIVNGEGEKIGMVTSGGLSPLLDKPVCLGYVSKEYLKESKDVLFDLGRKTISGSVVKLPFIG